MGNTKGLLAASRNFLLSRLKTADRLPDAHGLTFETRGSPRYPSGKHYSSKVGQRSGIPIGVSQRPDTGTLRRFTAQKEEKLG